LKEERFSQGTLLEIQRVAFEVLLLISILHEILEWGVLLEYEKGEFF
jgi:hypothetical protein